MSRLFIDIETIPTQSTAEVERIAAAERERNAELVKPHSEARVIANIDEAVRKTALDGAVGEVVCVAIECLPSEMRVWKRDYREAGSEAAMLTEVLDYIDSFEKPTRLCGHNVTGFDIPFLRHRAFVLGLQLPPCMYALQKPWDAVLDDTMLQWTGGASGKAISLDRLCRALGVPGKGELDGAGVWDAIQAGRLDEVAAYCADDVRRARECHQRMIMACGTRIAETIRKRAELLALQQGVAA